jgi:hypothetical protein
MIQRNILESAVNVAPSIAPPMATLPAGVEIDAPTLSEAARVLTPAALSFVTKRFDPFTTDDRYVEFLTLPAYNYVD